MYNVDDHLTKAEQAEIAALAKADAKASRRKRPNQSNEPARQRRAASRLLARFWREPVTV